MQPTLPVPPDARRAMLDESVRALSAIRELVDAYPEDTKALIDEATFTVTEQTQGKWPFKGELLAYRLTLEEVSVLARAFEKTGQDSMRTEFGALAADCDALIEFLNQWMGLRC